MGDILRQRGKHTMEKPRDHQRRQLTKGMKLQTPWPHRNHRSQKLQLNRRKVERGQITSSMHP